MKDKTSLKNILGLTLEESAIFFGVSKGNWSMITIGKRSLPLEATIKLGDLLEYKKKEKPVSEARLQLDKAEQEKLQLQLQQDFKAIQYKLYNVTKKMATIEKIRTECFAALEVADFIDHQKVKQPIDGFAKAISSRVKDTLKQYDLYALEALQLKKESLENAKMTLEKRIKGF